MIATEMDDEDEDVTPTAPDTADALADLCGCMDYTFIDIPDLVDSDEDDMQNMDTAGIGAGPNAAVRTSGHPLWPLTSQPFGHPAQPPQTWLTVQQQAREHVLPQQHPQGLQHTSLHCAPQDCKPELAHQLPQPTPQLQDQPSQLPGAFSVPPATTSPSISQPPAASTAAPATHIAVPWWAAVQQQAAPGQQPAVPAAAVTVGSVPLACGGSWSAEHQWLAQQQSRLRRPAEYGQAGLQDGARG